MTNKHDLRIQNGSEDVQECSCKYCGKKFMASIDSESEYCSIECLKKDLSKYEPITTEQMKAEAKYQGTMQIARKMLSEEIITEDDYRELEDVFAEKYNPLFGKLFSSIDLNRTSKE